MHCSNSLGFNFKNHGWQFGVVIPWGSQIKTASLLQSAKTQTQKFSHIFIKAIPKKSWNLLWKI